MKVQREGRPFTVEVSADGEGLISHAGTALLGEVADKVGLTPALSHELAAMRRRRSGHDPGRVVRDIAVMLADGGEALADLGAIREQAPLFGTVASDSTAYRAIERIARDPDLLEGLRSARKTAREHAWGLGIAPERVTIDLDASLIDSPLREGGRGRELQGWLRLPSHARLLRRDLGGGGRGAAARQRRCQHRRRPDRGRRSSARADPGRARRGDRRPSALRLRRRRPTSCWSGRERAKIRFSVGFDLTEPLRKAIAALPEGAWRPAEDQDGAARRNGEVAELTHLLDLAALARGLACDRPPRAAPSRRPALLHRFGRPSLPGDPHRSGATGTSSRSSAATVLAPGPRSRSRIRQGHRPRQAALPRLRDERRLARARPDRPRSARLGEGAPALRRARPLAPEAPSPPPAARRRPPRLLGPRARVAPAFAKLRDLPAPPVELVRVPPESTPTKIPGIRSSEAMPPPPLRSLLDIANL